jgi:hypothetical protein
MGVYMVTVVGSTPIGGPLVGWISGAWGPRYGLAIGGVATLLTMATLGVALLRSEPADRAGAAVPGLPDAVLPPGATPAVSAASG